MTVIDAYVTEGAKAECSCNRHGTLRSEYHKPVGMAFDDQKKVWPVRAASL